jgi:capsular polysaccharide transport system permease protein
VDDVPGPLRNVIRWNPVLHVIELVRDGWFVSYDSSVANPTYVLAFVLGFLSLGLLLERVVRRRIELS